MRDTYEVEYGGHLFFIAWNCSTLPDPDTGQPMGTVEREPGVEALHGARGRPRGRGRDRRAARGASQLLRRDRPHRHLELRAVPPPGPGRPRHGELAHRARGGARRPHRSGRLPQRPQARHHAHDRRRGRPARLLRQSRRDRTGSGWNRWSRPAAPRRTSPSCASGSPRWPAGSTRRPAPLTSTTGPSRCCASSCAGASTRPARPATARPSRPAWGTMRPASCRSPRAAATPSASSSGSCARRSAWSLPPRRLVHGRRRVAAREQARDAPARHPGRRLRLADRRAPADGRRLAGLRARALAVARHDRRRPAQRLGGASGRRAPAATSPSTSRSDRVRRARWIVDGVRQGQDLGRLLGARLRARPARRRRSTSGSTTCAAPRSTAVGQRRAAERDRRRAAARPRALGRRRPHRRGDAPPPARSTTLLARRRHRPRRPRGRARLARRRPRRRRRRRGRPERLLARPGQRPRGGRDADGGRHRRDHVPAAALRRHAAPRADGDAPPAPARRPGRAGRAGPPPRAAGGRSRRRPSTRGSQASSGRRATSRFRSASAIRRPAPPSAGGRGDARRRRALRARPRLPRAGRRRPRARAARRRPRRVGADAPPPEVPAAASARRHDGRGRPHARRPRRRLPVAAARCWPRRATSTGAISRAPGPPTSRRGSTSPSSRAGSATCAARSTPAATRSRAALPVRGGAASRGRARRHAGAVGVRPRRRRRPRSTPTGLAAGGAGAARADRRAPDRRRRARRRRGAGMGGARRSTRAIGALGERIALLVGHALPLAPSVRARERRRARRHLRPPAARVARGGDRLARPRRAASIPARAGCASPSTSSRPPAGRPRSTSRSASSRTIRTRAGRRRSARRPTSAAGCACWRRAPGRASPRARAGLVLGASTEAIPGRRQTAGLAVHFDAPSARAPQAILLCSAEPGTASTSSSSATPCADPRPGAPAHGRARDAGGPRPVPAGRVPARRHHARRDAVSWQRLEATTVDADLVEGQEARIADPLWLLGRQWQVGELTGEDAASPMLVEAKVEHAPVTRVRTGAPDAGGPVIEREPAGVPLEMAVEREDVRSGAAAVRLAAEAGLQLLRDAGRRRRRGRGRDGAAPGVPAHAAAGRRARSGGPARARAARPALVRRPRARGRPRRPGTAPARIPVAALDGLGHLVRRARQRAAPGRRGVGPGADGVRLPGRRRPRRQARAAARRAGVHRRSPRLVQLRRRPRRARHGRARRRDGRTTCACVPTPARFAGQAASRWWQVENGYVWFGDLGTAPEDLARVTVAVVRSLVRRRLVPDSLPAAGRRRRARPAGGGARQLRRRHDHPLVRRAGRRRPRVALLRAHRRHLGGRHGTLRARRCPWLFIAPALAGVTEGRPIEEVALRRDEVANLAWAGELRVESAAGRTIDRAARARAAAVPPPTAPEDAWRYTLASRCPSTRSRSCRCARPWTAASTSSAAGSRPRRPGRSRRGAPSGGSSSRRRRC